MTKDSMNSSYREKLIEHLFIGELLKFSWQENEVLIEVSKPEVDNSGYDIIIEYSGILRHIQLKASFVGSKTASQSLHLKLSEKPSGCVIWIYFDKETLELGPFYFFGDKAGKPLPNIEKEPVARHSKANSDGYKAERPNIRKLNKGKFERINSVDQLFKKLFITD